MTSAICHISVDCGDAYGLGLFWAEILGHPLSDEDHPGDPEALIELPEGPAMLFIRVPEGKAAKNRLHLDLAPQDRTRDEEVERLVGLGATIHEDHRRPDGRGWVTMKDIEGNEFCVERGASERSAAS